jgi:hypothetical protein
MADEVHDTPVTSVTYVLTENQQGASPREIVLEACRRNNTDLLQEVFDDFTKANKKTATASIAQLLNGARDGIGNGVLHLAATNGNCTVLLSLQFWQDGYAY